MLNVRPVAFLILLCTIEGIWQDKVGGRTCMRYLLLQGQRELVAYLDMC